MRYDAFISYSHAADGRLAPALQSGLHHLAKPWYRLRALHVFRDATNLAATPGLWPSIESALGEARFFVLMASPEAAASPWVMRELAWWLQNRSSEQLLIVLTDGDLVWRAATSDFDPQHTTALPDVLLHCFKDEPLHVDLRWARTAESLSLRHGKFRSAVLDIAAPLHGRPKDLLDGEDVRQYRLTRGLAIAAGVGLTSLTALSVLSTYHALQQRDLAVSRQLAATATAELQGDPELSVLLAIEALRQSHTVQAETVLRQALLETHLASTLRGHRGSIHSMALDVSGSRLLTGSADKTARIWDLRTGSTLAELVGHEELISDASFSPDGSLVMTASAFDQTVRIWRVDGFPPLVVSGHTARWIAGERPMLLVARADANAAIWDIKQEKIAALLKGHADWIYDIAVSPNGRYAVTTSRDKTARIWDIKKAQTVAILRGHDEPILHASISPNGERVATFDVLGRGRVWTLPDGVVQTHLVGHTDRVEKAVWSRDGQYLATASRDQTARLWLANTGQAVHALSGHQARVVDVAWSADGGKLLTASADGTARVWTRQGNAIATLRRHGGALNHAMFSSDELAVFTVGLTSTVRRWNTPRGWRAAALNGHDGLQQVSITSDGRYILTSDRLNTLRMWEAETGTLLHILDAPADAAVTAPSPAGDLVVHANRSEPVATIHEVMTGRERARLSGHTAAITCAAWSLNSSRIVTASWDGSARVWDSNTGASLAMFQGHGQVRVCPVMSPDGSLVLVAGSDGVARVWEVESGQKLFEISDHTSRLNHLEWSANGAYIVTSGSDYMARVYNAATGKMLNAIRIENQQGHGTLSADGRWLLAPGTNTWMVWDLQNGTAVSVLDAPAKIDIAVWSPDGKAIITGTDDGNAAIRPWALYAPLSDVLAEACERVTANLTGDEWVQYLGASAYRATCLGRPVPEWPDRR